MATTKQVSYALSLLGGAGYNTRYMQPYKSGADAEVRELREAAEMTRDTVPCQGNDDCRAQLPESAPQCSHCRLAACSAHSILVNGDLWCEICLTDDSRARKPRSGTEDGMRRFTGLSQIEQFAETPANFVRGRFSCLLSDVRVYGCYSADTVVWIMSHDAESGQHPRAIARYF